jgi:hypothetical protein
MLSVAGETMLEGIRIKPIKRLVDERGFFCEVMRRDWGDLFGDDEIAGIHLFRMMPILKSGTRLCNNEHLTQLCHIFPSILID